jgi:hypothetical protein
MKINKSQRQAELSAQYKVLSEIESEFGYFSKHKVALFVQKKMLKILNELSELKNQ